MTLNVSNMVGLQGPGASLIYGGGYGGLPSCSPRFGKSRAERLVDLSYKTFNNVIWTTVGLLAIGGVGNVAVQDYLDLRDRAKPLLGLGQPQRQVAPGGRDRLADFAQGILFGSLLSVLHMGYRLNRHINEQEAIMQSPEPAPGPQPSTNGKATDKSSADCRP